MSTRPEPISAALVWDALMAAKAVRGFVADADFVRYESDLLLRSAVERQFEILGEAMSVLRRSDPESASRIADLPDMVGMRNVLIHAYAEVNNKLVWETAIDDIPGLVELLQSLLDEFAAP